MKQYTAKDIRNVAFTGHAGVGKTSLAEAMLYLSGTTNRLGRITGGTTICDFGPEEIKRQTTVSAAIAPFEWRGTKINLIDTPGLFDFVGGVKEGFRAAGSTVIVISARNGVEVGTEKAFKSSEKKGIAKIFFINELDVEHTDFYKVFEELKSTYGPMVSPIVVPYMEGEKVVSYVNLLENKAYEYKDGQKTEVPIPDMGHRLEGLRTAMNEAIAETDEGLMEKYFSGEEFTPDEKIMGLAKGVRKGEIAPVFCGSAFTTEAVDQLMDGLIWLAPYAETRTGENGVDVDGNKVEIQVNEEAQPVAIVFKTVADPFVGKLSYFKVISGIVKADSTLLNMTTGENERIAKVYQVLGKKQTEVPQIVAGDIGAVAKLDKTNTGDTLASPTRPIKLPGIEFPKPNYSMAVSGENKADEEKISIGINRMIEEDPTIEYEYNKETKQRILSGLGDQHLDVIAAKIKQSVGAVLKIAMPKVPYRETIKKKVKIQGKHKKQSGGHGQFGDVWIVFEPTDEDGLVFEETVFGGSVPKNYFPAVEKGIEESMEKGILAGYPVVGLKATLVDGSYHPVDSSEMAFKLAAALAYREGLIKADAYILEPVGTLQSYIPNDNTGDVMGDITKRRGRVLGMNPPDEDGLTCIEAEVPMGEMGDYSTYMRSVTQGRGHFGFQFERYEEAPKVIADKIIAGSKK